MNYDKNLFNLIKENILSSQDNLNIISNKMKNAILELNSYNLINNQQKKTSINNVISVNDEMLSFVELTIKNYDAVIEEISGDVNTVSSSISNNNISFSSALIASSITELSLFSRDLSNVKLFDNVYAGYYYAQNDARWRDIKYVKSSMGGGACQTLAIVNSLANLGFYDTYDKSEDPVKSLVLSVKEIIVPPTGKGSSNLGVIIKKLNDDRIKNGKTAIDISVIGKNENGFCQNFDTMMEVLDDTKEGSSKWLAFRGSKGDTFIDRIEYIEKYKEPGDEYSYSVCRVAANPGQLIGGTHGHYLTINNFKFNEKGKITDLYVYDSYARDFEDQTVILNGKECNISGYIATNKKNKNHLFEMITPGLLKIPRDIVPDCGFGSGNLIVTKIKEGN